MLVYINHRIDLLVFSTSVHILQIKQKLLVHLTILNTVIIFFSLLKLIYNFKNNTQEHCARYRELENVDRKFEYSWPTSRLW